MLKEYPGPNSNAAPQKKSPIRMNKIQGGGPSIFNQATAATNHADETIWSPVRVDLDVIDTAGQSSEDDSMGDYDYNIETNRIVKTRRANSIRRTANSRRSRFARAQTEEGGRFLGFNKSGRGKQDLIKMLIKR